MRFAGPIFCLGSGAAFGAMGIFGKLAYGEGATVGTLLAVRFLIAAALFWAWLFASGAASAVRALRRRDLALALGLGACGYAAQAGGYFSALQRLDPALVALLVYTFPAMVAIGAVALGRERVDTRRAAALVLALAGLALVLAAAGAGTLDALGAALALGAAVVYSTYILVSQGIAGRVAPLVLSALVCTGAAVSLTGGTVALGQFHPGALTAAGWGWLACLSLVSTVGAIALFFAGLRRVGPTAASVLATIEPPVTVLLAFVAFGDTLRPAQLLGGALVVASVPVLVGAAARPGAATDAAAPAAVQRPVPLAAPASCSAPEAGV